MSKRIKVFAPATVANVACGFDILGFALNEPGDEMVVGLKKTQGIHISDKTEFDLPEDPVKNTAGIALQAMLDKLKSRQGFEITILKKVKPGSGIGSSAASAVAGVFAANELLGKPFTALELLPFAMEGERYVTGVAHADNVGPALLGGFILIRSYDPLDVIQIPHPKNLYCTVVHPQIEVRTEDARKILRKQVSLKDAVTQWGNVAGLVAGLMQHDMGLIGRSLHDVIIEPIRSILIPGYDEVKEAVMNVGALGSSISGSGPSIFALSASRRIAHRAGEVMKAVFDKMEIYNEIHVSKINDVGPKILY